MLRVFYSLAVLFGLLAGVSNASTIGSVLGATNRISDNSLEALWNKPVAGPFNPALIGTPGIAGGTILDVGDRLVAIGRIDQVTTPFPGGATANFPSSWTDEFTFVSVIDVVGKVPAGGGSFAFTFGPSATDPLGLGWKPGTAIAFYSDPSNNFTGAPTSIANGISTSSNGAKWWEFGFNGTAGESWNAFVLSDDVSTIGLFPPSGSGGFFNFGLNLIASNAATFAISNSVAGLEFTGSGNLVGVGPGGVIPGGWQSLDNYDASLNGAAVPEPTSVGVFGLLSVLGLARFRRK